MRRAGATLAALGLAGGLASIAHAAGILSQGGGSAIAPVTSSLTDTLAADQNADQVAAQAQSQLSRVAAAMQAMQNLQASARNLALTAPSAVPDGLQSGGLVPDSGLASPGVANPVTDWTGAQTPVQSSNASQTTVTINQTAAQALLSWDTFNVSPNTTVNFNQHNNSSWAALNTISASTSPAQILGSIKASGQVYVIDPNGIIFGGASQVNVGALIASSANISASQFLANGIYSTEAGATYAPSFTNAGGAITVDAGAQISANGPASVTNGGGFVLMMGTQVHNAGAISTPSGQAELAAGDNFLLRPGIAISSTNSIYTSTTAGNEIAVELNQNGSSLTPGGSGLVENTGSVTATAGDITLAGETVVQNGLLLATTTVTDRGTIHLLASASDTHGSITLGGNGDTLVEPDLASTNTELDSQRAAEIANSATANGQRAVAFNAQFDDLSQLADQQEESRIEIVSGGSVQFQGSSDTSAPGGQIAVSAVDRIQANDGSLLDVSGSYDVAMAMSSNDIAVNIQDYELRDDPQNRLAGGLVNSTVYVNANALNLVPASAAYATDRDYTQGGLLEVSGELANVKHTIGEYTAVAGSIDLSTGPQGAIVAQAGAKFDINGGSLAYQAGDLAQSYVIGSDGQIYNVNNAPADITYTGVYNGYQVVDSRWSVTSTYGTSLNSPGEVYQPGYIVGRSAGSLTLSAPTTVFAGSLEASAVNGAQQTEADPASVTDPYTLTQNEVAPQGALYIGTLNGANLVPAQTNVSFGDAAPATFGLDAKIPGSVAGTTVLDAAAIDRFNLSLLQVITDGSIDITAPLSFAPGAQVSLYGSSINIGADVTTPAGSVSAGQVATVNGTQFTLELQNPPAGQSATGDTVLAADVTISTAGIWSNLALDPEVTFTQAFRNGGAVSLGSANNLTLAAGSRIDTSSGGVVAANGATTGGSGGAISLAAATPSNGIPFPTGNLTLDGTLDAIGATKGGALTLSGPAFLITSAQPAAEDAALVTLDPAFFTQGFSAYALVSPGNITVAPGTVVNVTEPTYDFSAASALVQTGAAPASALTVTLNPLYMPNNAYNAITQRPGASFSAAVISLAAGAYVIGGPAIAIGEGAAINVDPGQSISLTGTGQITLDGSLQAPGGAISAVSDFNTDAPLSGGPGTTSVWVGDTAVLDASAIPVTFASAGGNTVSLAPAGGSVTLGSNLSTASVIIRQGAVISASGSAATDRIASSVLAAGQTSALPVGQDIPIAGAGGAISLASLEGIYNDGTLVAAAGGPNAAGGSLSETLEADAILNATGTAEATPRIFTLTQSDPGPLLPSGLQPGQSTGLTIGTAQLSAQQIAAGGFGSVTLYTRDAFVFQGNVTLNAAQSINLEEGYLTDSSAVGAVTLNAPYVTLSGGTGETLSGRSGAVPEAVISGFSAQAASGAFTVNAALIRLANQLRFGGVLPGADLAGFSTVNLNSTGDLQFDAPTGQAQNTDLVTEANLNLSAREVYALGTSNNVTKTGAIVVAGYAPAATSDNGNFNPAGVINISAAPGTSPVAPYALGGSLTFTAATINQGGVVLQPLGNLTFGVISGSFDNGQVANGDPNTVVNFLPGSITSVSAAGLTIPFGGTTDGVTYDVAGQAVASATGNTFGLQPVTNGVGIGTIMIAALTSNVESGAELNLQGGGTLTGEGFISGANGSSDVLVNPLLNIGTSSITQPSLAADPVYAIVTGPQPAQALAYTASGALGSTPALGAQIVIPAGVPGLPAGTYTLLPASYALNPGGYRVELDGAASLSAASLTALPNGSYRVAGFTALANTAVHSATPSNFTITPGSVVPNYAKYDGETYSQYLVATAANVGGPAPVLPVDAGNLVLQLPANAAATLTNTGSTLFQAAAGGNGGTLTISGAGVGTLTSFDIFGTTPTVGLPAGTVSLSASQIDAFGATTIAIGQAGQGFQAHAASVTLENGATLSAPRVVITATTGGITLKSGSAINTLGQGALLADSTTSGLFNNGGASVLDVGNGYLAYSTTPPQIAAYGPITVEDGASIYSDGSIVFSTSAAVNIGVNADYGAKYLDLSVPEINIGDPAALGATVPSGLLLTPAVLQTLAQGVPGLGVPAVQIMVLTASDSLNFYGTTALDLPGANVQLVINTPAIYGFGGSADTASISANTIVWNGTSTVNQNNVSVSSLPGGAVTNGPGSGAGTLNFDAQNIILGYSDLDQPQRDVPLNRLTLGFATVNLNASSEITANNQGTLAVYQSQAVFGQAGSGGTLNLNTPLLTADNQASIGFTAGGAVNAGAFDGQAAASLATETAGGEIDLTGENIGINTAIILPSGKLDVHAANDISLGAGALLNLAGATTTNATQTVYGFGGSLIMASAQGNITAAAGSAINVSAVHNTAGSVSITAQAPGAGQVSLLGTLAGSATGGYDSGSFTIAAQDLGDFAALNASLDAGQFTKSRSFEIGQGDLVIGNGVQAQNVNVSVDNGSLTVNGLINASFNGGGAISLAASDNLILASTAVLDAHGTTLQVDSNGQPIASENAPKVSLTTASGELTLASGAQIDLASADGVARGDLELNVPRLASATSGDANINAAGTVNVAGAATIAVNAFWTYTGLTDPNSTTDGLITQAYLDGIDSTDSQPFMANAATNADLAARIAGLSSYGASFHLRPGVQIVSATPNGDLTVSGDLDLSGYRYTDAPGYGAQIDPAVYGSGEPGVLNIRAGGNLNIYGSITDGFAQPAGDSGTEFATGWVVYGGEPYGHNQTLPVAITVAAGSGLSDSAPVNFAVAITGGTFAAGAVAPAPLTVSAAQTVSVAFVATSAITAGGTTLFARGQIVPAGSMIPAGAVIDTGGTLPFAIAVGPVTWPANTPFTVTTSISSGQTGVVLAADTTLQAGAFIPAGSALVFVQGDPGLKNAAGGALATVQTRPVAGGTQGQLYGLASLLPLGDASWSIGLVSGANLAAASPIAVAGTGGITLADTHYGITGTTVVPAFSVVRTGTGSLSLVAGGSITENSAFGIYTAGAQSAPMLDGNGNNEYDLAQGFGQSTSLLGTKNAALATLVANYAANYPTAGGDVLVSAQGDLNGFINTVSAPANSTFANGAGVTDSDAVGAWLWRQGGAGQPGAWWIEYGSLNLAPNSASTNGGGNLNGKSGLVQYTGFQGIGTLGGGNLSVNAGGNASGLDLAVAANGRVQADGTLVQEGGGAMDVNIGGALNFIPVQTASFPISLDAGGVISDLRGNASISAGSIGNILPVFGAVAGNDPRTPSQLDSETANFGNGIDLLPGDGTVTINARGDLVIDGAGNPGTVQNVTNSTPVEDDALAVSTSAGGNTDFSLWTSATAIGLFSAGGDVAPIESNGGGNFVTQNASGQKNFYPPNLLVASQNGNIYFGDTPVELAPSPAGQLQLLAAGSIIGDASIVSLSGAALDMVATPFNPGINVYNTIEGINIYTNDNVLSPGLLVDFGADTPTGPLHNGDTQPALIFAGKDILNIEFGETVAETVDTLPETLAAKPFDIIAGRDIVDSGSIASPDVFLNLSSNDVTSITAGRDIIESSFDIAGPRNLVVQAGRDINLTDQTGASANSPYQGGVIDSIGPIFDIDPNNRDSGAGVSVSAGVGAGPDYAGFADQFLNPASTLSLSDASQIIQANDATLYTWLQTNDGYAGTAAGAYAYFLTLAPNAQDVFLRQIYYQELNDSGLEYNKPSSVHYKSYILGQTAIAALFPATNVSDQPLTYAGDITLTGDSGIHTEFGGNIDTLTPGGQTIVGVEGVSPPSSAGFITEGNGDINIYSLGSVLLGESRVLTTFGGNILIWTAKGDINAGQGSKTTIDYTPLQRVYDNYGNVSLSPSVPSSGAGIATLNPIPAVPAGNINLVAPVGTVNAGSAGIRVSGNLNIAAQLVVNGANIQVQGTTTGVPVAVAPNIGSLTSASGAAGAAAQAAENATGRTQSAPVPSIWIVEILGYGGGGTPPPAPKKRKHPQQI